MHILVGVVAAAASRLDSMQNGDGSCPNDPRMHPGSMSRMSWHDAVGHRGSVNVVLTKHTIAVLFSGTDKEGKVKQSPWQPLGGGAAAFKSAKKTLRCTGRKG